MAVFYEPRIFPCGNKSAVRLRWRKDTAGRYHWRRSCHVAADLVPVFRNLGLQMNSLVYIQRIHLTLCTLRSDVRKIRITPDLSERNLCIRSGDVDRWLKRYTHFEIPIIVALPIRKGNLQKSNYFHHHV